MKQTKGIVFDLDGTLWDSSVAVVDSWNEKIKGFPEIDYIITCEQMQGHMGKPMDEIAYAVFNTVSKERALEMAKICMEYENEYIEKHGGVLFEGLEEVLNILKKDYFLAIVSNCQEGYIEAFMSYHNLSEYFMDTENFGHTGLSKGKNIRLVVERNNLKDAVYVGDTLGDYNSANEAGIPFLHAAYGFGSVPEGTPFIKDIRELPKKVKQMMG